MTEDDYDAEDRLPRAFVVRRVLAFTLRLWGRMPWLTAGCAAAMLLATLTEVFVPLYAGTMIDAVSGGNPTGAWRAFAVIAALGGAMVVLRHLGWRAITPLTLNMMRDVTQEAFVRGPAAVDRLACQRLFRLHRATDHARHVGARHVE